MSKPTVVAVFNSSDDMVELLRILFERHGFVVVTGHIGQIRRGELDLNSFVEQHKPDVVVYDLVPPVRPAVAIPRSSATECSTEGRPIRPLEQQRRRDERALRAR